MCSHFFTDAVNARSVDVICEAHYTILIGTKKNGTMQTLASSFMNMRRTVCILVIHFFMQHSGLLSESACLSRYTYIYNNRDETNIYVVFTNID